LRNRFLFGVGFSAFLLALLLLKVDLGAVGQAFVDADPGLLVAVALLHVLVLSLKAVRWHVVLGSLPEDEAPVKNPTTSADRWLVYDALFLGYFGNYALPAKLGELARSVLYSKRRGAPLTSVVATIVFERFLDALTLVAFFWIVAALAPLPDALPDWVQLSANLAGAAGGIGLLGLILVWRALPENALAKIAARPGLLGTLVAKLLGVASGFRAGLAILQQRGRAMRATAWTIAIWAIECGAVWLCFRAFGHDLHWTGAVVQVVISSFAIAAPSAPGGLGIHQWVTLLIMVPFGATEGQAISASLVLTFVVILWVVPIGLHGLWRQGSSTSALRADVEAMRAPQPT
jgi:uncharacterized protein (TIRG00374 family)